MKNGLDAEDILEAVARAKAAAAPPRPTLTQESLASLKILGMPESLSTSKAIENGPRTPSVRDRVAEIAGGGGPFHIGSRTFTMVRDGLDEDDE